MNNEPAWKKFFLKGFSTFSTCFPLGFLHLLFAILQFFNY